MTILSIRTLDGSGQAQVSVAPPFNGTTLDGYDVQAVTSPSPRFVPPHASAGAVVGNGDAGFAEAFAGAANPLDLPPGIDLFTGRVLAINSRGAEHLLSSAVQPTSSFTEGFSATSTQHGRTGRRASRPLTSLMRFAAATTMSVTCGTLPAGCQLFPAYSAVNAATVH